MKSFTVFWFRRDLRLEDNCGLFHALKDSGNVLPLFIFDRNILDELEDKNDARVHFIHQTLGNIKAQLIEIGSDLKVVYGKPEEIWATITKEYDIKAVYTNKDYEPYATERDQKVGDILKSNGIPFHQYKDHVITEFGEVLKDDGDPYVVFSPFKRKWFQTVESNYDLFFKDYNTHQFFSQLQKELKFEMISLESMGFHKSQISFPSIDVKQGIIRNYDKTRNFPGLENGTSRLGIHFRFGTISIREKARKSFELNKTYLNELIWRDFYSQILAAFPRVVHESFRPKYDQIQWRNNQEEFEKWCEGKTGYKIVDAGMRELNNTGYMHNRVRMITASFLTKHLLIDWRWGEAYFAKKLLDYDLASNNGGWQWAAGSGTDAAPYFRIFNPYTQITKFDKNLKYITKWVPEHDTNSYPKEIVEHKMARERCLETYKMGLDS